jgi:ribonuclease HI
VYLATGMPRLVDQCWTIRVEELMVTLNAKYPSTKTCWARLGGHLPDPVGYPGRKQRRSRAVKLLEYVPSLSRRKGEASVVETAPGMILPESLPCFEGPTDPDWRPACIPSLHSGVLGGKLPPANQSAYTDGSTAENRNDPSGCAAIMGALASQTLGFACHTRGNNYLAEMIGILYALVLSPAKTDLTIFTDSRSAIDAVNAGRGWQVVGGPNGAVERRTNRFYTTQRRRILNAARPQLNVIRAVISQREGHTALRHVKAHSGATDKHSRMNEVADREANRARIAARDWKEPTAPLGFAGEAAVGLKLRGWGVTGSYRTSLLYEAEARSLRRMKGAGTGTQSCLARECGRRLLTLCKTVRRTHNPDLMKFTALAIASWLPTEANRLSRDRVSNNCGRGGNCKICGAGLETVEHALCHCTGDGPLLTARRSGCRRAADVISGFSGRGHKGKWIKAWFDPSGNTQIEVCPEVNDADVQKLTSENPLAGALGILPASLDKILGWRRRGGAWERSTLAQTQKHLRELQTCLVWSAFHVWTNRCQAMDHWFRSDEALKHRQTAAVVATSRSRKRLQGLEKKRESRRNKKAVRTPPIRHSPWPARSQKAKTGTTQTYNPFISDPADIRLAVEEAELRDVALGAAVAHMSDGLPWY